MRASTCSATARSGLSAIIAVHSTKLGPAAGGVRFWHYADTRAAITDALRLSRGMSYKNAMANLPLGGGKGVILASEPGATVTTAQLEAFGRAVEIAGRPLRHCRGCRHVRSADESRRDSDPPCLRPARGRGRGGRRSGPITARGVYLGVKAAAKRGLGADSMAGVRVAIQGVGSVGGGVARLLARDGAKLVLADVNAERAKALRGGTGRRSDRRRRDPRHRDGRAEPNALGAIFTEQSIAALRPPWCGRREQPARHASGRPAASPDRGILYAPDYVINAGGIINVGLEYLGQGNMAEVMARVEKIPERLIEVWDESARTGDPQAKSPIASRSS